MNYEHIEDAVRMKFRTMTIWNQPSFCTLYIVVKGSVCVCVNSYGVSFLAVSLVTRMSCEHFKYILSIKFDAEYRQLRAYNERKLESGSERAKVKAREITVSRAKYDSPK